MASCFEVAQSSVAKYMVKRCGPTSPGWSTFLRNPSTRHRCHGPIHCSDHWLRPALFLSSFDWSAETLSGSTSHAIRPRNGCHARSQRHSLGLKPPLIFKLSGSEMPRGKERKLVLIRLGEDMARIEKALGYGPRDTRGNLHEQTHQRMRRDGKRIAAGETSKKVKLTGQLLSSSESAAASVNRLGLIG